MIVDVLDKNGNMVSQLELNENIYSGEGKEHLF